MRRTKPDRLSVALLFGAGALLAGCAGNNATGAPAAAAAAAPAASAAAPAATPTTAAAAPEAAPSAEDEESEADLGEHHRHHHHGGVTMFIAMSLDSLGVSPDQAATLEKIQGDLFAKMEPAHVAEQNVLNVLADGIAVGKIDEAKVETAIAAVKKASAGVHDAALDSLKQLHDTLTPEQRAALVDKVDAHWEVWKSTNNMDEMPGDADHPGHIDRLAKDVNLAPDQVAKIRATFSDKMKNHPQKFDPTQVEAHLQEFGAAFEAPSFDPKTLPHGAFANQHLAVWGARRMAHFYEAVDPLLTPEQRTKLSGEIKEHAAAKSGVLDGDKHER